MCTWTTFIYNKNWLHFVIIINLVVVWIWTLLLCSYVCTLFSLLFFLFLAWESCVYVMCMWCNVYIILLTLARPSCHVMLNWLYFYIFLTIFNQVFPGLPLGLAPPPSYTPISSPNLSSSSYDKITSTCFSSKHYQLPLCLSYPWTLAQQSILCSLKRDSVLQIASEHLGGGSCNNQAQNLPGHVWPINLVVTFKINLVVT